MSDGITEARRGTYWNNNKWNTTSTNNQTTPYNSTWEYKDTKVKNYMPNQKWHRYVSFAKSIVRIGGYFLLPFDLGIAMIVLIFSETIGVIEELV